MGYLCPTTQAPGSLPSMNIKNPRMIPQSLVETSEESDAERKVLAKNVGVDKTVSMYGGAASWNATSNVSVETLLRETKEQMLAKSRRKYASRPDGTILGFAMKEYRYRMGRNGKVYLKGG